MIYKLECAPNVFQTSVTTTNQDNVSQTIAINTILPNQSLEGSAFFVKQVAAWIPQMHTVFQRAAVLIFSRMALVLPAAQAINLLPATTAQS
jgi:hypothetical protein